MFAYAIGGDITSAGLYDSALYLTVGQSGWFNLNTRIQITIGLILESHIGYYCSGAIILFARDIRASHLFTDS